MKYEIIVAIATSDNHDYIVHEKTSNQFIERFKTKNEAKKLLKHFNMGGGFDGWTPEFILKKVVNISNFKEENV